VHESRYEWILAPCCIEVRREVIDVRFKALSTDSKRKGLGGYISGLVAL
jgi:hypothetical protein